MIEIPKNEVQMDDYEKVVQEVLSQLATGKDKHGEGCIGTAYIDWGVAGDFYKNCPPVASPTKWREPSRRKDITSIFSSWGLAAAA